MITVSTTLYGISDEYHQSFVPGRDVSALDALADGVGGFLAAQMLFWWDRARPGLQQSVGLIDGGDGGYKPINVARIAGQFL